MPSAQDPRIGQSIGGYRIQSVLASSGSSSRPNRASALLYVAEQIAVARTVVLEFLPEDVAADTAAVEGFLESTRAAARLGHAHIAQIHDVYRDGVTVFYSMEYLPGGTLATLVGRKGPVPFRRLASRLRDVADALDVGASQGILHGDLGPTHLLFTQDKRIKIIGLGIPSIASSIRGAPFAASSLPFLAPERFAGAGSSIASDLYALGATFHFALSGSVPYRGVTRRELGGVKAAEPIPSLASLGLSVPERFSELLERMTSPSPGERPESYGEVLDELESFLPGIARVPADESPASRRAPSTSAAEPDGPPGDSTSSSTPKPSVVPTLALVGAAAVVALVVVVLIASGAFGPGGADDPELVDAPTERREGDARSDELEGPRRATPSPGDRDDPALTRDDASDRERATRDRDLDPETPDTEASGFVSKSALERRGLAFIEALEASWAKAPPGPGVAERELDRVEREYPVEAVRARAAAIRERWTSRDRAREYVAEVIEKVDGALEASDYRRALAELDDVAARFSDVASDVESRRATILDRARLHLVRVDKSVRGHLADEEFARAESLLRSLESKLPEALGDPLASRLELVAERAAALEEQKAQRAQARKDYDRALRAGDFTTASELLGSVFLDADERKTQQHELELSREMRNFLAARASSIAKSGEDIFLFVHDESGRLLRAQTEIRKVLTRGHEVLIEWEDERGTTVTPLVDVAAEQLVEWSRSKDHPHGMGEGIVQLLFHRRGPGRAWFAYPGNPRLSGPNHVAWRSRCFEATNRTVRKVVERAEHVLGDDDRHGE